MSLVLQPGNSFTVVRQIANHTDTGTYYVQAVIRNAYTDAILATLQLEDKGGQRFKKNWQVPADASGEGFYVSMVTSVYTDSGYTTKSENYGDEENTYLVQNRVLNRVGGFGPGSGGVDARTIRRILREELDARAEEEKELADQAPAVEEEPKKEVADRTDEVLTAVKELKTALKPEKPEKVDLKPLITAMSSLAQLIEDKEVTPVTDLAPILDGLRRMEGVVQDVPSDIQAEFAALEQALVAHVGATIHRELENVKWESKFVTKASRGEAPAADFAPTERPAALVPFDIKQLAS